MSTFVWFDFEEGKANVKVPNFMHYAVICYKAELGSWCFPRHFKTITLITQLQNDNSVYFL